MSLFRQIDVAAESTSQLSCYCADHSQPSETRLALARVGYFRALWSETVLQSGNVFYACWGFVLLLPVCRK
jgi:hypothetical protein